MVYTWTVDTTPPKIICPANITVSNLTVATTNYTGVATATDNCGAPPVVSYTDSVSNNCGSVITRTWTATDACGNSSTCQQIITVPGTGSICGYVYLDCDGYTGTLDGSEPGLNNAMVILMNSSGVMLATNMTDATGAYCFYNLAAGTYVVSNAIPGYAQTGGTHCHQPLGQCEWTGLSDDLDHYAHYKNQGTNCWVASDTCTHWKDKGTGLDTWIDKS